MTFEIGQTLAIVVGAELKLDQIKSRLEDGFLEKDEAIGDS